MSKKKSITSILIGLITLLMFSCQKQLDTSTADINALKASVSALQKTTDSLSKALATTNGNLQNLSFRVDSIKTQIIIIQNQITILNNQITINNSNIVTINNQITILNQQYLDLLKLLNDILSKLTFMPTSLQSGLVAYYPFTGNANDSSGFNNHGTTYNVSLIADRFGNSNSAYSFAGNANSYIDCGSGSSLKVQKNISISIWFYMNGGYYNPRLLCFQGASNGGYLISSTGTSNSPRTVYSAISNDVNFGGGASSTVSSILPALTWTHLAFVCDSTGLSKLYLNGKLIDNTQCTPIKNIAYDGLSLNIGRNNHPAYDAWGGYLDDIRIYNRVISDAEITYLSAH